MTELRALLVVCLACAGCATTGGHDWLSSPVDERAALRAEVPETPPSPTESRPRLSQTVTLGETYGTGATPAASSGGPAMQVNVHTQVPVVINNYSGYGYGYGSVAPVRAAPARATSGAPTKVGGDFPAPPDYGPRALK